jgi:hypothetical protein
LRRSSGNPVLTEFANKCVTERQSSTVFHLSRNTNDISCSWNVVVVHVDWVRPCLWTVASNGPVVHSLDDMSMERDSGMVLTGETEELGEEPVPVPLCPPQIPHGLTRARTRASAVTKWGYFYSQDLYCDIVLAKSELSYHVLTYINDFDQCNLVYTLSSSLARQPYVGPDLP